MKYFIGADHAGIEIKAFVKDLFEQRGHEVEDLGAYNKDRVDYPDFAAKVCKKVAKCFVVWATPFNYLEAKFWPKVKCQ